MSKLDELMAELCPDGVEYKRLEECCNILDRKRKPVTKSSRKSGEYPYYGANGIQDYVSEYIFDGVFVLIGEDGSVITPQGKPVVNWAEGKIWVNNHAHVIEEKEGVLLRYLYHYIQTVDVTPFIHGNIPKLTGRDFKMIAVPVPPLEVQREIVRVLDSFTLLTAELTVEFAARKKQYEFYREKLLSVKENIPIVKLKDIATDFYRGAGIKREEVTEEGLPCVRYGGIYTTYNTWFEQCVSHTKLEYVPCPRYFGHGDILFVIIEESVDDIAKSEEYIGNEKCLAGGDIVVMKHNQNSRYLAHVLSTTRARAQKSKGKVKSKIVHSNVNAIQEIEIPLPSLEIQERYADALDDFETICTDLNIGLPAEIEARKKQYEFYRDALLTFAETNRNIEWWYDGGLIKLIQYVFGYITLPMGTLFDFRNGLSKGKDFFGKGTPFIRYTDVYNNRLLRKRDITALVECTPAEIEKLGVHRGDVFFTRTSETAEDVGWSSVLLDDIGDCVFNGFTIKATPKTDYLLPEYCAFCFATDDFRRYVTSHCAYTTRASLTGDTIAEYQLMFPDIERQQEIVDVLSKFDTLCTDLSAGLPGEIKLRQKQYEYYRDKLLSFKKI